VTDYAIVGADEVEDAYEGTDVPGEFRSLKDALGCEQLAATLIRVPPHSDFEQGNGHHHEELEELYIVSRGTLTMRLGDEVEEVRSPAVVRVAPGTTRSHRNEGDEPVEIWAVSKRIDRHDATKVEDFWAASDEAAQKQQREKREEQKKAKRRPRYQQKRNAKGGKTSRSGKEGKLSGVQRRAEEQ